MLNHSQLEIAQILMKETDRFIQGLMGYLNALLYSACKFYGVAEKAGTMTNFFPRAIGRILDNISITVPLTWLEWYFKAFWSKAPRSVPTLRRMRSILEDFGVFVVEKQQFLGNVPKEERQGYVRATYHNFDVKAALRLYEMLEKIWLERGRKFEELPEHRGAFVRSLYELVFANSTGFNRADNSVPLTMEQAAMERAAMRDRTNATLQNQLVQLWEDIGNFKRIGLDRKEPTVFAWMVEKWREVKGAIERRMAEVPY